MKHMPNELREVAEKVKKGGHPRASVRTLLR